MDPPRRSVMRHLALLIVPLFAGCMMIGPDYRRPAAPVAGGWVAHEATGITHDAEPIGPWWETFGDPKLTELVETAYRQNPSLQAAGVRVIAAQARRGIAISTIFPQTQNMMAHYYRAQTSENTEIPSPDRSFNDFSTGFDVAWEVDLWGKFRRGVESADAELVAAAADY